MSLRHALLGLLSYRPASGYDLLKAFETSLANVWPATQSQVYGELGRLTDAGLLEVSAEGPRGRKEYTITGTGRGELHTWLVSAEPTRVTRSDMLLRVFFLDRMTAEEGRAYLARQRDFAAARAEHLRALEASIEWDDSPLSTQGRIALEYGLRLSTVQTDWADWALEQLATGGAGDQPR
ncbi:PadR family transcriptional regulator [Yinghuangia seranimata]|uniref:PadR family transcriptional regulator n=1 Tax=Yinghuangia seranimata TaxID=408067 RepID=UPI00248AA14A|nr:helix-turn-helix transcriptional regulator [Yinghuangia seranimata]MDI2130841.1 helix-turn-helix transcriptional regulator [Yinghuangia seranimata]